MGTRRNRRLVLIGGATALLLMLSTGTVAGSPLSAVGPAKLKPANAVLDWTEIAENTIKIGRPPASSEVLMGIVQVAIFDTVVAIEGGYEPYAITPTVNRPVNEAAAVAAAAGACWLPAFPRRRPASRRS